MGLRGPAAVCLAPLERPDWFRALRRPPHGAGGCRSADGWRDEENIQVGKRGKHISTFRGSDVRDAGRESVRKNPGWWERCWASPSDGHGCRS